MGNAGTVLKHFLTRNLGDKTVTDAKANGGNKGNGGVDSKQGGNDRDDDDGGCANSQARAEHRDHCSNLGSNATDDCTAIAGNVYGVGLIESAPIDLEAEVGSSRIRKSRTGPEKEESDGSST